MGFKVRRTNTPKGDFTIIRNDFHRDPDLSSNAHRIGCVLLSHGPSYVMTTERLGASVGVSEKTAASALAELEASGYLVRPTKRTARAKAQVYIISDERMTDSEVTAARERLDSKQIA